MIQIIYFIKNTNLNIYSVLAVFGLLETPADVSGQGYEAGSDTASVQGQSASVSLDASVNRASTSADDSRLGYCTNSCNVCT